MAVDPRDELWIAVYDSYFEELIADALVSWWEMVDETTKVLVALTASGSAVSGWILVQSGIAPLTIGPAPTPLRSMPSKAPATGMMRAAKATWDFAALDLEAIKRAPPRLLRTESPAALLGFGLAIGLGVLALPVGLSAAGLIFLESGLVGIGAVNSYLGSTLWSAGRGGGKLQEGIREVELEWSALSLGVRGPRVIGVNDWPMVGLGNCRCSG